MTRLAVFDIDGTLCDTNAVDNACFVQAVAEFLAVDPTEIDWSAAPHVTDSGLLDWLCASHRPGVLNAADVESVVKRFVDLLLDQVRFASERFRPIPGATAALASLPELQWDVALATGGWLRSAQLKLSQIGLDPDRLILATSNDATKRADIVQTAVRRAEAHHRCSYSRIVSIGDAPWDVNTAAQLDIPFVGIGSGHRASHLREAGAATILEDLTDLTALRNALEHATVPASGKRSVSS